MGGPPTPTYTTIKPSLSNPTPYASQAFAFQASVLSADNSDLQLVAAVNVNGYAFDGNTVNLRLASPVPVTEWYASIPNVKIDPIATETIDGVLCVTEANLTRAYDDGTRLYYGVSVTSQGAR